MDKIQYVSKKVILARFSVELKKRETASREIRKQIHASSGMDRWHLWNEKREYGSTTRYILLARAIIRGMPYAAAEKKSDRGIHIEGLARTIKEFAPEIAPFFTPEFVRAWYVDGASAKVPGEAYQNVLPAAVPSEIPTEPGIAPAPKVKKSGVLGFIKRLAGVA